MDDSLYDILYLIYDYFYEIIGDVREFIVGYGDDSNIYDVKIFILVTVPILFAALEAIFDFILPTFMDLRPMGIKRLFLIRSDPLKVPELKSYKTDFNSFRFIPFRSRFRSRLGSLQLTPEESKKFNIMYQQKYNTTATPMQLKRFVLLEGKRYSYISGNTGLTSDNKVAASVKDASLLGKGVTGSLDVYKDYKYEKEEEECKKAV